MIVIALLFIGLACWEWRYLRRYGRSRRAYWFVLSTAAVLLVFMEAIYALREKWTTLSAIESIFGPIQKAMMAKK